MGEVTNYKCPNCTAPLKFSASNQNWDCEFCESTFTLAELEKFYQEHPLPVEDDHRWQTYDTTSGSGDWDNEEAEHILVYSCPSCGAEVVGDDTTAATACPYCHNTVVLNRQVSGEFRPDFLIPFKTTRDQAVLAYHDMCKGKKLLPKDFTSAATIEKLTGIYVPFWVFDCDVDADMAYNAEQVSTWRVGDYQHTRTDYYLVRRSGTMSFSSIPVDGSSKINDDLMDSIEPFDYRDAVEFNSAYLSGFLADKYDQTAAEVTPRVEKRVRNTTVDTFRNTVTGYTSCRQNVCNINIHNSGIRYLLLPVWMLNTKYEGKDYTFAMNGQTGRMVGNLPISKKRAWGWFLGLFGGIAAALYLAATIIGSGVL